MTPVTKAVDDMIDADIDFDRERRYEAENPELPEQLEFDEAELEKNP